MHVVLLNKPITGLVVGAEGFADGSGVVGFINPVSQPFCDRCDRLRLTADGQFLNFLFSTNDWDAPKKADKPNVGGRLEYSFEEGHVAVCSTYEPIKVPDSLGRLMVDADLSYKMGALTAFAETNYGSLDETASTGFMGKLNYALTDGESFTVRWDYLDSDMVDNTFDEAMSGAFAFLFTINDNLIGAAEIKTDFEASERTTTSGAVELIGSF